MKKILSLASILLGACFLMPSCTEEDWGNPIPEGPPAPMPEMTFFDFDVAFDETERTTYAAMQDLANDEYYVENHDFVDVVTITFNEGEVEYESTNPMVMLMPIGAHVEAHSFSSNKVEFILKGTCSDGSFKLATCLSDYKITLSDLNLTNPNGAAIYILSEVTSKAFIYAQEGTANVLTGCLNENSENKATLKGSADMIFCGRGQTKVLSQYKHAIDTNGEIYFRGGCKLNIVTEDNHLSDTDELPGDGVHANGNIVMTGGEVEITSVGDGVQSGDESVVLKGGYLKVTTTGEKAHALKAAKDVNVVDGALHAIVKGAASKGISTDGGFVMSGGAVTLLTEGSITYDAAVKDLSSCAGVKTARNVTISGGTLKIKSTGAAGKGINCDESLYLSGDAKVMVVTTGTRAIHESGKDSNPKGVSVGGVVEMNGEQLWVKTLGGTSGTEAIDASNVITIKKGEVKARAFDDCVKSDSRIVVNGGSFVAFSDGNDGFDAPSVEINGGVVIACGTNEKANGGKGNGINYDTVFAINGGTVIATGGGDSMPTASAHSGYSYKGSMVAGQALCLHDTEGAAVMTYVMQVDYSSLDFLFVSPDMQPGSQYRVCRTTWDKLSGGEDYFGYNPSATCSGETQLATFTASNGVYSIGN